MAWSLLIITFIGVFGACAAMVYALAGEESVVARRLGTLWKGNDVQATTRTTSATEKLGDVLGEIGKLLPASAKDLSQKQLQLVQAGIRQPGLEMAVRGLMLVTPVVCVAVVYFTGLYRNSPFFVFITAAALGYLIPDMCLRWAIRTRQQNLRLALPDALDLLVICVESGLGLDQAMLRVAQELRVAHRDLSEELQLVNLEMRVGRTRLEALRALATRTGVDDIKGLVAMLIQTDRFGTSVAQSLRIHSDDLRIRRRQRAEEMAAKTSVKIVPALVFFIFPALMIVILGPAVITLIRQFANGF
jgi:tight adherence protein C